MLTHQSAAAALYEELVVEEIELATSILSYMGHPKFGNPTDPGATDTYLSYGSLAVVQLGSDHTETRQLFPWMLLSESFAIQQGTRDIHTSGELVISVFANSAWRLLITSTTTMLPRILGGESIACGQAETLRVLVARLYAQPAHNKDSNSHALNVWRAVVPVADAEEISSFVRMVVRLSQRTLTSGSKASQ
jgi:hypothetical protein